tara:strand:- start:4103 stop:4675 length:573 start_codon:yes stop_codon:yes gene_type:complete
MVSVFLICNNDYWLSIYAIENLLKNSGGVELELLVIVNGEDKRIIQYLSTIIDSKKYLNLITVGIVENEDSLEKLFLEAKGEYICLFNPYTIVNQHWLMDLVYYNYNIQNSGISAIYYGLNNNKFKPLISHNDEFINVWQTNDNIVSGVFLFKKDFLQQPIYQEQDIIDYFTKNGYLNYYIPTQNSIKII